AKYIIHLFYGEENRGVKIIYVIQTSVHFMLLVAVFALVWFCFPERNSFALVVFALLAVAFIALIFFAENRHKLIISCTLMAVGVNLILNSYFYPALLTYQAGSEMATKALENGVTKGHYYS